jgi:hypothetical protein
MPVVQKDEKLFALGRPVEGIFLNGLEYVMADPDRPETTLAFSSEDHAYNWIKERGATQEEIDDGAIIAELFAEGDVYGEIPVDPGPPTILPAPTGEDLDFTLFSEGTLTEVPERPQYGQFVAMWAISGRIFSMTFMCEEGLLKVYDEDCDCWDELLGSYTNILHNPTTKFFVCVHD